MPRVEIENAPALYTPASGIAAIAPLIPDDELETPPLPREHPRWVKDALAVSQRARHIIALLKPVVIKVMTFWDHHFRSVSIGQRSISVDLSGSYRLD